MHPPRLNLQYAPAVRKAGKARQARFEEGGPTWVIMLFQEPIEYCTMVYVGIRKAIELKNS